MNKIIYISLILCLFLGVSCTKNLTQLPTDSASDEQIFSTVEAAQTALNAAHRYMGFVPNHTMAYILSEVMGDDITVTSGTFGRGSGWHRDCYTYSQVPSSSPSGTGRANSIWIYNYKSIDHANSIIKYLVDLPASAERDNLIAKAYGARGYCYLQLIRFFAPSYNSNKNAPGVILRLDPANASSEHLPRSSASEVYNQIVSDLKYAFENITGNATDFITDKSAALLMARAYLDMSDYTNALKYAEAAASNVFDGSNLMSQEEWASGFKDHNSEWLWWLNFTSSNSNGWGAIPTFYYHSEGYKGYPYGGKVDIKDMANADKAINMNDGFGSMRFTKAFVDMFEDGDCRKKFPFYFYEEDGFFTSKFSHRTIIGDAEYPMARISEAYLIKAECEVHLGGDAAGPLNALQTKRGATATEASLDNIYIERRKELYGEGHRIHDIRRLRQPLVRSTSIEHWSKIDLPADSPRFMLPMPEVEMLHNNVLTDSDQNEYWK